MEQLSPLKQSSNLQDDQGVGVGLSEGAHSWAVTDAVRLRRFLCYGSEGSCYSARERPLVLESAPCLVEMLEGGRGCEVVLEVRRSLLEGLAVRPEPCLFALAVCSQRPDVKTKQAAFRALVELCRSPGQLFAFVQYKKELKDVLHEGQRGGMWGRGLRKAVCDWYNGQDAVSLASAVTGCRRRGGWTHRDLFRLAHLKPANDAVALISKYVTKGWKVVQEEYGSKENPAEVAKVLAYFEAVEKAKRSSDEVEMLHLIEEYRLDREQILNNHFKSKEVWKALLKEMPPAALMKRLGKMTADKLLLPGSPELTTVCERIRDGQALTKAKLHPFSILVACEKYKLGLAKRGKLKWEPNGDVVQALDSAFTSCLSTVDVTGKRLLVAVDVSSNLHSVAPGSGISTVTSAAAISMVIARTEPNSEVVIFSGGSMILCPVSDGMSLIQMTTQLIQNNSNITDCTLPILWALENDRTVDAFIVLTNNEAHFSTTDPAEALRTYRQKAGIFSKLIVCSLTSNELSLADPDDRGMLDMCGFDLRAADVIRNFVLDTI